MEKRTANPKILGVNSPHFVAVKLNDEQHDVAPWEEIDPGRFMPRRVRGSNRGRALG